MRFGSRSTISAVAASALDTRLRSPPAPPRAVVPSSTSQDTSIHSEPAGGAGPGPGRPADHTLPTSSPAFAWGPHRRDVPAWIATQTYRRKLSPHAGLEAPPGVPGHVATAQPHLNV